MMYLKFDSMDAKMNFALEKYAMDELDVAKEYFMFWRTTPTLMVGRYQNTLREINMPFARERNIDIVRRVTGGGTIYTDENGWQFSFIVKEPDQRRIEFNTFTQPILDALHSIGVPAERSGRNDLVIGGRKFSGNAQYLRSNVVLHHGSLLFNTDLETLVRALSVDDKKIVSKGIASVRQRVTNIAEHLSAPMTSLEFRDVMLSFLLRGADTYEVTPQDITRITEIKQAQFDTFKNMVPCKILDEAVLLYGSHSLYEAAKGLLAERGIREKLAAMERAATEARERAEKHLLNRAEANLNGDDLYLFYTSEESEEFE